MKLAWLTDTHLNFVDDDARDIFYQKIVQNDCDAVLISGDIAEAPSIANLLVEMAMAVNKPLYFVLGNHDYYRGEVSVVRESMMALNKTHERLCWLSDSSLQLLGDAILVGQDGWADGRLGDYQRSSVSLNDSRLIADLFRARLLGKAHLLAKMQQLADADANRLRIDLELAVRHNPKQIIVLTHVPPFKEACLYQGEISTDDYLPYFGSKIMGDLLQKVAQDNPSIDFLVLCGHTHEAANYQVASNLMVKVGSACYYQPEIQEIITV